MNGKSLPMLNRNDRTKVISASSHFNKLASYLDYLIVQKNDYIKNTQGKAITFIPNLNSPKKTIESINLTHVTVNNSLSIQQANKQLWD
jgi:hypothetical protein